MFDNFPSELKILPQWVLWRLQGRNGKPTKVPYTIWGEPASSTKPDNWSTFDAAKDAFFSADGWYSGIGFVLTDGDPYAFIDLDDPAKIADEEGRAKLAALQMSIFESFSGYAEVSPSGKGCHIIVKGGLPAGVNRGGVELYSSGRYMTVTGNVIRNDPIVDQNIKLNDLYDFLAKGSIAQTKEAPSEYVGCDLTAADSEILLIAAKAKNGSKFSDLCCERWADHYLSQSQADFAYINIVAHYTKDDEQVRRIFLASFLGARDKAKRTDYLDAMITKCRDQNGRKEQAIIESALMQAAQMQDEQMPVRQDALSYAPPKESPYSLPCGLVGEIAAHIYSSAPRCVPEIALIASLAFVSAIVGRAYNVSGTGLNQYLLLLANTGTGKESMSKAMSGLISEVIKTVPDAIEFLGPGRISSAQAMMQHVGTVSQSFVTVFSEFGGRLAEMGSNRSGPHMSGLKDILLELYNKSGDKDRLFSSITASKERNISAVKSPALSVLAESAPDAFFSALTEGMVHQGLLPRFITIDYRGSRPNRNRNSVAVGSDKELVEKISKLCSQATMLNRQDKVVNLDYDDEAIKYLDEYDISVDKIMNESKDQVINDLWSRAHMKVLRLAGVLAVGCDFYRPRITIEHAKWAVGVVDADILAMHSRFSEGAISSGDACEENRQLMILTKIIDEYKSSSWSDIVRYRTVSRPMHLAGVITYSHIYKKVGGLGAFKRDRMGVSFAIKKGLKHLSDSGRLVEVDRGTIINAYQSSAVCYYVKD
jgi:Protein of unknown function (DUF3987)